MSFFIKEENVRPGNRGGRTLFNWNDIRLLNNKERESYLGVTQSIGFLDKGGKWRKRDWWQQKERNSNSEVNNRENQFERERIKQEEDKLFNETLNNLYGTTGTTAPKILNNVNKKKEKLTVFEWKELMKKDANINPNDPKIFEFYENDEHKRGLGMKPNISFRTNPYEKDTLQNLRKIDGEGFNSENDENMKNESDEKGTIKNKINNIKIDKNDEYSNKKNINNNLSSELTEKKCHLKGKSYAEIMDIWEKEQNEKKKFYNFSNLEIPNKNNKDKIEKKHKKKKSKKSKNKKYKSDSKRNSSDDKRNKKRRGKSYSKSRSRSRSNSRNKHKY